MAGVQRMMPARFTQGPRSSASLRQWSGAAGTFTCLATSPARSIREGEEPASPAGIRASVRGATRRESAREFWYCNLKVRIVMYLWPQKETTRGSISENSFGRVLTMNQFTSFRVIPHALWQWERSSESSVHPGLVVLPASFWRLETIDG